MKETGIYSLIIGIISIVITVILIDNLAIQVGILLVVLFIFLLFMAVGKLDQVNKNTKAIMDFDKKLKLHDRLNNIEGEIKILKGGKYNE